MLSRTKSTPLSAACYQESTDVESPAFAATVTEKIHSQTRLVGQDSHMQGCSFLGPLGFLVAETVKLWTHSDAGGMFFVDRRPKLCGFLPIIVDAMTES